MEVFLICYHSIAPRTFKDYISACAIIHLSRFIFFNGWVGLNRFSLATLVAYPIALHSALLRRKCSQ